MNRTFKIGIAALACVMLAACSEPPVEKVAEKQESKAPVSVPADERRYDNNVEKFANNEGVIGVFPVGEMLCLSIIDSAAMKDVSFKVAKNYSVLEQDLNAVGAVMEGPPGQISYNNDPENFKFECFILIKSMPEKQPEHSNIVVMEATKMLIYNHYGPYQNLYQSYEKIRQHIKKNKLVQTGPLREFYLSDPMVEKDPAKWITRIMLPVK